MTSVLIVDSDGVFRWRMQRAMRAHTRTSASLEEGLADALSWQPAVILLPAQCGTRSGIAAMAHYAKAVPRAKFVVVADGFCEEEGRAALAAGAFSYCDKGDDRLLADLATLARRRVEQFFAAAAVGQ